MELRSTEVRVLGPPEVDGEYVALRVDGSVEEIVHLHDYPRFYAVPGLYEHVVQELLGCCSPQVAAAGFERALTGLELEPHGLRVLDLGAGTGLVGELLRGIGVKDVIGVDALEPARVACLRDRPGVYRDYLVGDLAAPGSQLLAELAHLQPTGLVSAGAFGGTHAPPSALRNAIALLPPRAPVVFTIDERWMRDEDADGFDAALATLLRSGTLELLERSSFQHRVTTTGQPVHYELIVAATGKVRDEQEVEA